VESHKRYPQYSFSEATCSRNTASDIIRTVPKGDENQTGCDFGSLEALAGVGAHWLRISLALLISSSRDRTTPA
jgi:hypothetical protein